MHLDQDQLEAADVALREAQTEAEALGSRRTLGSILVALGEIKAQRGQPEEAHHLRRQAAEIVTAIADNIDVPELRRSFLSLPQWAQELLDMVTSDLTPELGADCPGHRPP